MGQYIEHLQRKLADIDEGIEKAKTRFDKAEAEAKQQALAELSQLRVRHDELLERIEAAKEKGSEEWSGVRTGIQEEVDGLRDTLESLLTRLG